jgi:DNA-binding beta-propeller fold protein YncE/mono/diheme cytochrome c family protein
MILSFLSRFGLQLALGCILWQSMCLQLYAQYANRYANNGSSESSKLATELPSKRSGYSHSAMTLGTLHTEGYDDLASFRPPISADGKYRKPKAIEYLDENTAIICTSVGGEFYQLNMQDASTRPVFADSTCSWSKLLVLDNQHLAAIDLSHDQVVIFNRAADQWSVVTKLSTPGHPHSLTWNESTKTLYVTGQWSQRLYRFSVHENWATWKSLAATDLPLHGGSMLLVPKKNALIIADAFGGDYVALQLENDPKRDAALAISHRTQMFAQNIASLHLYQDGEWILFPFQLLDSLTTSIQGNITWGGLISNNIRWLRTDRMLTQEGDELMRQSKFVPLGEVGNGAGDPTSLRVFGEDKFAVTLGGIDAVAIGRFGSRELEQFPVGLHPLSSVFSKDGNQLFVINEFSDSVSRVELATGKVDNLPLGPLREPTLVERGERLFFHSKLAHDGWMSCHSCHSQGHTSGQLNDNTSDGSLGSPKRILSLLGQAETAPYSWGGEIIELEQQVLNSLQSTMATDHQIARGTVDAIAAYVRTLPPPPSIQTARREQLDKEQLAQGRALFEQLSCNSCHAGSTFTSPGRYDVNLRDERGQTEFNPPSLIGVSQRSNRLLHDGRANSVEEVIVKHQHQLPRQLESAEISLLVDYLNSL